MLHAAALMFGLALLWMLVTQRASSPQDWAIVAGASFACMLIAVRFGGVSASFARSPRLVVVAVARAGAVAHGALTTIRAAVSADVTMRPALVRIKTRAAAAERASFANLISAIPGMAVVETDVDGFLVHVIDEEAINPLDLGRLEQSLGGDR